MRKLRCIDDFKINDGNAHTVLVDKIVLPNFELLVHITPDIFKLLWGKAPELTLGLDERKIMSFIGKPIGRSLMISSPFYSLKEGVQR